MTGDPDAVGRDPDARDADDTDHGGRPSTDLKRRFVLQVMIWNAVLLVLALGILLVTVRGRTDLGGALIAAGLVLAGYGVIRYPDVG